MIREVLRMGDPRLLQRSQEVRAFGTPELQELLQDMRDTMAHLNGAGLAAPQIGVGLRLVIFGVHANPRYPDAEEVPDTVLINPVLTPLDAEMEEGWEGCLSVPGMRGVVPRKDARDAVEKSWPVARHDRQHLVRTALVGPHVDRRRDREVPHAPRKAPAAWFAERRIRLQLLGELGFDHGDAVLIVRIASLAHGDKRVERIAVARGVDLRLGDIEAGPVEVAADAREERFAVLGVDHHLQALAKRGEARLDHRLVAIDAVVQVARVPGDLLRVMAQAVGDVAARPPPPLYRL